METLPVGRVPAPPVSDRKWYEIWWSIWRHPGEEPFKSLLNERNHSLTRGLLWYGIASLVIAIYLIVSFIQNYPTMVMQLGGTLNPQSIVTIIVVFSICWFIFIPVIGVASVLVVTGIYHWLAKLFKGSGKWEDLLICVSAVQSPSIVLSGIITLISTILLHRSGLSTIPLLISAVVGLYVLVLEIHALKTAEHIGTGGAAATVLIPAIILSLPLLCIYIWYIPRVLGGIRY